MISTARLQIILEKRKNIPRDVFLLILEYGIEKMPKYMLDYIPKCVVLSQRYFIQEEFHRSRENNNDIPFWYVLEQKCMDPEKSLEILSKCKCCKRHQKNRPTDLNNYVIPTTSPLNLAPEDKHILLNYVCNCPCRNYSRWIVRSFYSL